MQTPSCFLFKRTRLSVRKAARFVDKRHPSTAFESSDYLRYFTFTQYVHTLVTTLILYLHAYVSCLCLFCFRMGTAMPVYVSRSLGIIMGGVAMNIAWWLPYAQRACTKLGASLNVLSANKYPQKRIRRAGVRVRLCVCVCAFA